MRSWTIILGLAGAAAALHGAALADDEASAGTQKSAEKSEAGTASSGGAAPLMIASNMPVFVPPNRGAPPMRLGGATRGGSQELPHIQALVPEEAGWTLEAQPVLYWHLQGETGVPVELVVKRLQPAQTLLEKKLPSPAKAGVQRIDLADHGVTLEPGASYVWFVKLIPDPGDRSRDRITGGGIERVAPDADLRAALADPETSKPHALAQAGIWYDALDLYSRGIEAAPADETLRAQRTALLEQVDLELN